jgi:hypothetical protein
MFRNRRITTSRNHLLLLLIFLFIFPLVMGCGFIQNIVGMHKGYLLRTQDVPALPNQKVILKACLESGSFLHDEENRIIQFSLDDKIFAVVKTDDEGSAEAVFQPDKPGDYVFTVTVKPGELKTDTPPQAELLVACRSANAPIAVVDLDGTVVAPDFREVLTGDPAAMPDADAVMNRLAADYTILYLTHRPEIFGPKSKLWLREHHFPQGPVLLANRNDLIKSNEKYKSQELYSLRRSHSRIQIGIGNEVSDAKAYLDNGLKAILILQLHEPDDPSDIRKQAATLDQLPDSVQVVRTWKDIESVLFADKSYPRSQAQRELYRLADEQVIKRKKERLPVTPYPH